MAVRRRQAYVERHLFPQFKDLVTRYQPSVIFSRRRVGGASETWRSAELLAWLFNESPVRDKVVVNDRWGQETRHEHGGYYTTEYGAGPARRRPSLGREPRHGLLIRLQPQRESRATTRRASACC